MQPAAKPRNIFGMIAIALFLGAPSLMLWMGRWKVAVLYLTLFIAVIAALFVPPMLGRDSFPGLPNIGVDWFINVPIFSLSAAALIHALKIRTMALARPWYSRWYIALLALAALPLVPAFFIRTYFYQPFNVPAASMMPTLMVGDYFLVSNRAYASRAPERGEIAIFRLPTDPSITYVKRVIGLPGDKIQMIGGVLNINGAAVKMEEVKVDPRYDEFIKSQSIEGSSPRYFRETPPEGRSYVIIDLEQNGGADDTAVFDVPAGQYFLMGDNRDNSMDSRYGTPVGFVPRENFIGPYTVRFYNSIGVPLGNRPE